MSPRRLASAAATAALVFGLVLAGSSRPPVPLGGHLGAALPGGGATTPGSSDVASPGGASGGRGPVISQDVRHDRSAPLRGIAVLPPEQEEADADQDEVHPLPGRSGSAGGPTGRTDPVLQSAPGSGAAPTLVGSFEGVNNVNGVLPPDTNGDIGPNHYVQWVNGSFAIYDRSGTKLYGPAAGNTLWSGFGGPCETTNNGDPIAQYDHLADRWFMSQFALPNYPSGPFYQCIAVSTTADPLGTWNRYAFQVSATKLNDYPHFGVWPDAYYMSINQFSGNNWGGQGAVAFERARMLQGLSAQMVYFDLFGVDPNLGGMLPSDLDGPAPPNGAPNVFVEADDDAFGYPTDQLAMWSFHVDWATPGNSTFTLTGNLPTAAFDSNMCGFARDCIDQPQAQGPPTTGLDAISDRIMYRLQYRNFGDHQSLIVNHTVDVDGTDRAGIRWYELRKTASTWSIYQQGTFSPDATHRWMASAAMNGSGDIGLGYSVSSASIYPSIRVTGRLAGDALGTLGLGETTLMAGGGSQTHSAARWGDYAMLAVDPTDDCTFWFTSEYLATTGSAPWRTRIGSFRLPGCGGGGDITPPAVQSFAPTTTSPTNAPTINYGLTFSESVTGLAAADFGRTGTATGCSIGAPAGSGASYTIAVTGCSNGTLALTLNANTVADGSTNVGPLSSATASTVTIDRTAPGVSLTAPASPTNAASLSYGLSFNESVTGLAAGDFSRTGTATGCVVGAPSGSGASYTVVVGSCSDGTVILSLTANTVTDGAGNTGPASSATASTVTIDRTSPIATLTAPASPTNATTLTYGLSFSESVSGLAAGDFSRTGTATGCVVGAPSGSLATYTVAVTGCSAGTVSLSLNANSVTDVDTNTGPASPATAATVLIDRAAPTTGAPSASLRSATTQSGTSLSVHVGWTAADTGGAGLTTYDVADSLDGAAFVVIRTGLTFPAVNLNLASGHTFRFEVRAHDAAGNVGAWVAGPTLKPALVQQTASGITYGGTWTTTSSSVYSGGSARYAAAAGASATYTFSGRSVGLVLARGPSRGAVKIYVDGILATTLDCYAATDTYRWIGFSKTWSSVGSHTVKLVVVGTVGRPRIVFDAIEVVG